MVWRKVTTWLTVALLVVPLPALAADPLVVSVWGGNWKDTVERVVAKPFTAKTGIPVEFEVGGTLDRLAKARVSKAAPLVDVTFTTTHVGRLYISDGLFDKLDMAKLPNARDLAKEAMRSDHHLGVWAYVYTIAYRPDQVKLDLRRWADPGTRSSRARWGCRTSTPRTSSPSARCSRAAARWTGRRARSVSSG
jgi:putative spermidine/putrescine transport system substrate-binding protein